MSRTSRKRVTLARGLTLEKVTITRAPFPLQRARISRLEEKTSKLPEPPR